MRLSPSRMRKRRAVISWFLRNDTDRVLRNDQMDDVLPYVYEERGGRDDGAQKPLLESGVETRYRAY